MVALDPDRSPDPTLVLGPTDDADASAAPFGVQRSFDTLGTPLAEVTFVVLDLETTGASPADCAITEIGAVRYRGGERLGTFQTLVNPGVPIPPMITVLTGITEAMVLPAPPITEVLPALLEFIGGAVIVGHNLRFDTGFLDAALEASGRPRLTNRRVDTLGLARRLLRDEVPDLKLGTLARHLRVPETPNHRALADAQATAEVLHALLERAGTLGVLGLDDLLELPTIRAHPSAGKLRLTARLPREPGVYILRDRTGQVLYVGKATNLRSRVRSYFGGDERRKVPQLLRETERIDHIVCTDPLEAEIHEIRLIQRHEPRYNRVGKGWRSYRYLRLTLTERFPRLVVVPEARADGSLHLGPFRSRRSALAVKEAIETAVPLRRCSERIGRHTPITCDAPCAPAQLGVSSCPCRGATSEDDYREVVARAVHALARDHRALLAPLEARMATLADQARFEEAAAVRDRLATLARALRRDRSLQWLRAAGVMRIETSEGIRTIDGGHLRIGSTPLLDDAVAAGATAARPLPFGQPPARDEVDEMLAVARWLDREVRAGRVSLVEASGCAATACSGRLPDYAPVSRGGMRRGR